MRIAILTNNVLPGREGIGRHVTEVGRRLRARGHRVVLLAPGETLTGWQDAVIDGLRVCRYPHLPLRPLHHAIDRLGLQRWLDAGADSADLVHVHLPLFPPLRTDRPLVVTFHTPMLADTAAVAEPGLQPRLARLNARVFSRAYEQWYLDNATAVLAVSDRVRSELESEYRTLGRHIDVVENGVDVEHFVFSPQAGRVDEILYVGRLGYRKGLDRLLRAFAALGPAAGLRLVIVGEGPLERELRTRTAQLGISERVEFTGFLDRDELRGRLQRAAVFVSPSDYEGFPLTLLEAMAAGAPVVTTRTGPLAQDPTCLPVLTVEGSVPGLADGIIEVLSHPAEAADRAAQARQVVEARYSWDRVVDALESCYRDAQRLAA